MSADIFSGFYRDNLPSESCGNDRRVFELTCQNYIAKRNGNIWRVFFRKYDDKVHRYKLMAEPMWGRNRVNFVDTAVVVVLRRESFPRSRIHSRVIFAKTDIKIHICAMRKRLSNEISLHTVEILKEIFYNSSPRVVRSLPGNPDVFSCVTSSRIFFLLCVFLSFFSIIYI